MNKQCLAQTFKVSPNSVTAWVRKGCPFTKQRDGSYLFDLKEVEAWRQKTRRVRPSGEKTLAAAQIMKENALADLRELELGRKKGELIERAKVEKDAFRIGRTVRDALLALPDRLSGVLAAKSSQQKIHAVLTKEFRQCLEALSNTKI